MIRNVTYLEVKNEDCAWELKITDVLQIFSHSHDWIAMVMSSHLEQDQVE